MRNKETRRWKPVLLLIVCWLQTNMVINLKWLSNQLADTLGLKYLHDDLKEEVDAAISFVI